MYNVVSYKDKPAVIISANNTAATVMYLIEEDNMVQAKLETIYDKTLLSEYSCPFADTAFPPRMYCTDGKCKYSVESPARLSFMCTNCLAASMVFDKDYRGK
jgi:hypothetical protein